VLRLLVTAKVAPSPLLLFTLMIEAIHPSKHLLLQATRRNIPENRILHNHRRENLKSYKALTGWSL
jgi:hypothetical protein